MLFDHATFRTLCFAERYLIITGIRTNIVSASEVDTSVGGLGSFNKVVDVGDTFFYNGGPQTQNSSVFTASNSFTGDLAYI